MAVANFSSNVVSLLMGNAGGTFDPHVDYLTGSQPRGIAAAAGSQAGSS